MIVTVIIVRVMEVSIDKIVDMVAVGDSFMPAIRPMHMLLLMSSAFVRRRATVRISLRYVEYMFIDMAAVLVMQMAIVQIIDMAVMHNTCVVALRPMGMSMIFVLWQDTISHFRSPYQ
ncbi:hypothetical protein [Nitrosovibrio sp. Nv4]|uniref:hypothetical protein n=1 Tax=Nitrosovibrio sp. Nv4 TaxID=1945880 RepID=UPI000BDD572F|nr:hypothetical protein [Nitrosovibrio sp. Nv4]SOD42004.1 hypothetical protein SAMN06298226_2331 [Nitrosovibrio sp. Nv4]